MKKKAKYICACVLSAVLMLSAAVGLYTTEENRLQDVGENKAYIAYAQSVAELSEKLCVGDKTYPTDFSEKSSGDAVFSEELRRMGDELRWLAEYDSDGAKLNRAADKLSNSEPIDTGMTYAQMSAAALEYHSEQVDEINGTAKTTSVLLTVAFAVGLACLAYCTVRLAYLPKQ